MITIPAGLYIYNREIDIEIQFDPECGSAHVTDDEHVWLGVIVLTEKIRDALEAAAQYQKEIGE